MNAVDPWGLTATCPLTQAEADSKPKEWKKYSSGNVVTRSFKRLGEKLFHCGYCCYLENREVEDICVDDPIAECCYDESGILVDENHPYSGCKGSDDQWPADKFPVEHTLFDKGGIRHEGGRAFRESMRHWRDTNNVDLTLPISP